MDYRVSRLAGISIDTLIIFIAPYACPYDYDEGIRVCWRATMNGTIATNIIEYDHGQNNFYDGVRYGIENCSLIIRSVVHMKISLLCIRYFRTIMFE